MWARRNYFSFAVEPPSRSRLATTHQGREFHQETEMKLIRSLFLQLSLMLVLAGCSSMRTLPPVRPAPVDKNEVKSVQEPKKAVSAPPETRSASTPPNQNISSTIGQEASSKDSMRHHSPHRFRLRLPPEEVLFEPLPGGVPEVPALPAGGGFIFEMFPFRPSKKKR